MEDDGSAKLDSEYHLDNNNKKPTSSGPQHNQQPHRANAPFGMGHKRPGQQHGLDIPTREDDDNKSQRSYRTMSSSRRQSTEESIDTDDEYFCYELRKLEELERIEQERRKQMDQSNRYTTLTNTLNQSLALSVSLSPSIFSSLDITPNLIVLQSVAHIFVHAPLPFIPVVHNTFPASFPSLLLQSLSLVRPLCWLFVIPSERWCDSMSLRTVKVLSLSYVTL